MSTEAVERELREIAAPEHLTDLGNARRLVRQHGDDLRYCHSWRAWLRWDGRRWRSDSTGEVVRRATATVAAIYAEAAEAADDGARKAIGKHATASESQARIEAMVHLARSEPGIPVRPEELDAERWVLNVHNGTLNLRSGELREHRREDRITKLAPVEFDADATHSAWGRILDGATGGDPDLRAMLKRAVGYSLSGDTSEEVLFFAHGPTASVKSTFLEAVKAGLGDYAKTADFDTFTKRRGDRGPSNDVARLAGVRFVASLEVDDGKALAEGLVKQLTGGDTVAARRLYQESFEFDPQMKLWLAANSRPRVAAEDEAMWRRIVHLPFLNQIPEAERDPDLKRRAKHDPEVRKAVLAWAVEGCLEWQRDGLQIPDRVRAYGAEYRAENDLLAEWIDDCCELHPEAATPTRDVRSSYEAWAEKNGEKPISSRELAAALRQKGCVPKKSGNVRRWQGIAVGDWDIGTARDADSGNSPTRADSRRSYRNGRPSASQRPKVGGDRA